MIDNTREDFGESGGNLSGWSWLDGCRFPVHEHSYIMTHDWKVLFSATCIPQSKIQFIYNNRQHRRNGKIQHLQ